MSDIADEDVSIEGALTSIVTMGKRQLLQLKRQYFSSDASASEDRSDSMKQMASSCHLNCSGNGECFEGSCYCMIRYEGDECKHINFSYHVAFASIFYLLALTSVIQLAMCIHAEYLRTKKNPSILKAMRITTQKFLYFLVFLACILRGTYFAAPTVGSEVSASLLSAYYPVVLTSASLVVCFWAEVFHLKEIRWDRPRFLSKSFLCFLAFNVISYSLLLAELLLVWLPSEDDFEPDLAQGERRRALQGADDRREFYAHIFNGCYAFLMFVVVIFFLIYGVEVFFKVRGGFTVPRVPKVLGVKAEENSWRQHRRQHRRQQKRRRQQDRQADQSGSPLFNGLRSECRADESEDELNVRLTQNKLQIRTEKRCSRQNSEEEKGEANEVLLEREVGVTEDEPRLQISSFNGPRTEEPKSVNDIDAMINTSQLHQSRLGLLSQALMMIITVGFLFAETLEEFWKTKVNLTSRNTHDVVFRTIEIGIALWFPCVLWNCIRPEQLWCLNPKKILDHGFENRFKKTGTQGQQDSKDDVSTTPETTTDEDEKGPECWICYDTDRVDAGPMIRPCDCRGDVGAVHHDCLRRWLVESADNPDALSCKVCSANYNVEKGSQFSLANGFTTKQWLQTATLVTIMCLAMGGAWAVIQLYYEPWIRSLAVGAAAFVLYICLRSLGLNTLSAYQRAKVSTLKILNLRIRSGNNKTPDHRGISVSPHFRADGFSDTSTVQVELVSPPSGGSSQHYQTRI